MLPHEREIFANKQQDYYVIQVDGWLDAAWSNQWKGMLVIPNPDGHATGNDFAGDSTRSSRVARHPQPTLGPESEHHQREPRRAPGLKQERPMVTTTNILPLADTQATIATVGGKGASLARLAGAGLPVPDGFHLTTDAYRHFVAANGLQPQILAILQQVDRTRPATLEQASRQIADLFAQAEAPAEVANGIVNAYGALPGANPAVAVRSSATAEDLPTASFAGQQETYLNVSGAAPLLEAVRRCWASLWTARAIGYRIRQGIAPDDVALAVVVQNLVLAEAAGILFTANPMNGRRDQVIINAAWGLGEAVVGGLVTPDTLTVDKRSGAVVDRQTADKTVMTVRVNGGTTEESVPADLRHVPVLDDVAAASLTQLGVQIEAIYGMPMDIEWALVDGEFMVLQARPITALPVTAESLAETWDLPDPKGHYMRVSITELMPDPLTPLFETLGMQAIDRGIGMISVELLNLRPGVLSGFMVTINGYAYQNAHFTLRQWWALLSGMVPAVPRMLREAVPYWQQTVHPHYVETVRRWEAVTPSECTTEELLAGVHMVLDDFGWHLGSLMTSTMGTTAGSEGLFTKVYEKLIKRPDDPPAPTFLMGYDSIPIQGEKVLYDIAMWSKERKELADYLVLTPAAQIAANWAESSPPDAVPEREWYAWQTKFQNYLDRFGYAIYDMDFAKPLPLDDPAPVLETLKLFMAGQGKDPYARQQAYAARREAGVASIRARIGGVRRWLFEQTLKWAQSQAPLREDGIAEIGLAYPVLRRILREVGSRLVAAKMLARPDDIYWLSEAELNDTVKLLDAGDSLPDLSAAVAERKAQWEVRKQLTPPPQLPIKAKYLGVFKTEGIIATRGEQADGDVIHGLGASPGTVTGTAYVLHGPQDFDQMEPGAILVASITTPAWTPLFAMAGGVVTDIGGPLSHGSIVAREYGIPAVLGTGIATKRIHSGQIITVDGTTGTVTVNGQKID